MAKEKGRLGKGLAALGFSAGENKPRVVKKEVDIHDLSAKRENKEKNVEISLEEIMRNPHQPRQEFKEESLEQLKKSIEQYGVLQPVILRKTSKGYELIAGERRCRAAKLAGLRTVPAIIKEYNDAQMTEVALIENIQREALDPIEEAKAYERLLSDFGLTQDMLAGKVGRSRSHIANFLRLLKLSPKVQELLRQEKISMGQAKPLLALESEELQARAAEFIILNELSARRAELLVKHIQKDPSCLEERKDKEESRELSQEEVMVLALEDKLKVALGAEVRIKQRGKRNSVEISCNSMAELNRIIDLLGSLEQKGAGTREETLAKLRAFSTTGKFSV